MKLILGDSLERLKDLPTNTIDAVVCDPPYGLSFMGKRWDYDVPSEALWREVFRVMKPGAHLLSFFGTRTYHAGVTRIEAAGFEVRDMLSWLYATGFPKSLDVSKAIDKAAGAERTEKIQRPIAFADSNCWGTPNNNSSGAQSGTSFNPHAEKVNVGGGMREHTLPATDDAKQWQGWGTALKPANEPIVLARKPLEKGLTVAQNVLKWGTGALSVDACRIHNGPKAAAKQVEFKLSRKDQQGFGYHGGSVKIGRENDVNQGRWPANVLFDEEAAAALDQQSGVSKSPRETKTTPHIARKQSNTYGDYSQSGRTIQGHGDSGGASRFFYVAKASKRERNAGLEGMPERESSKVGQTVWTNECQVCGKSRPQTEKQCGSCGGEVVKIDRDKPASANHHPTVKPIKLMEYLCKLVTPPGGIVLDPFMGSGTTGCAAAKLGFQFIGIEREAEYIAIAEKRIAHWAALSDEPAPDDGQLDLPLEGES